MQVLAPYRGYGVGRKLLAKCLEGAAPDAALTEAVLHVQVCGWGWLGCVLPLKHVHTSIPNKQLSPWS